MHAMYRVIFDLKMVRGRKIYKRVVRVESDNINWFGGKYCQYGERFVRFIRKKGYFYVTCIWYEETRRDWMNYAKYEVTGKETHIFRVRVVGPSEFVVPVVMATLCTRTVARVLFERRERILRVIWGLGNRVTSPKGNTPGEALTLLRNCKNSESYRERSSAKLPCRKRKQFFLRVSLPGGKGESLHSGGFHHGCSVSPGGARLSGKLGNYEFSEAKSPLERWLTGKFGKHLLHPQSYGSFPGNERPTFDFRPRTEIEFTHIRVSGRFSFSENMSWETEGAVERQKSHLAEFSEQIYERSDCGDLCTGKSRFGECFPRCSQDGELFPERSESFPAARRDGAPPRPPVAVHVERSRR